MDRARRTGFRGCHNKENNVHFIFISMLRVFYEASKASLTLRTFGTFKGFVPALVRT